jgi:hypothetical protein
LESPSHIMKRIHRMTNIIVQFIIIVLVAAFAEDLQAFELDLGGKLSVDIHGFLSQGYLKSDYNNFLAETEEGTFEFREYGINVSSDLTDQLHVGTQIFGRDFGDYGNDKIVLDWAFADFRFQDWLGIRAGKMKAVLGLYNETRDIDMVRTSIFLSESIYNDAFRESFTALNGIGIYGTLASESLGSLSYQGQWGKIKIEPDGGVSKYLTKFFPMDIHDVDTSDIYITSVEWTPVPPFDGLRLRWTWNIWEMDDNATTNAHPFWQLQGVPPGLPLSYHADLNVTTLSAEYRWGNLILAAETFAPASYDNQLKSPVLGTLVDDSPDKVGYYASAAYSLTEWLELGVSYSEYYNSSKDKDGKQLTVDTGLPRYNAWLKDTTLTARFDILENLVIKAEGHLMNGTDIMLTADNPDGTHENWFLFGCKVTYSF